MERCSSYLLHYGIKGQKWGIRRYQNRDGTYTDLGLKRRKMIDTHYKIAQELSDEDYDLFTGNDKAHENREGLKRTREIVDYVLDNHSKDVVMVSKNGAEIFISNQGKYWEAGWAARPGSKRKGTTSSNLKEAINIIRKYSDTPIKAYILDKNTPSSNFALKNGFEKTNKFINIHGNKHREYIYKKET
jgi:hypothetical protein